MSYEHKLKYTGTGGYRGQKLAKTYNKLSIIRVLLGRSKYSFPDGPMAFFGLHIWWVNDLEGYS